MAELLSAERHFMRDKIFIDTNIFIYAHDIDSGIKHEKAASIMVDIWENKNGIISTQVIQEFYVNVTRKIPNPLPRSQARGILENYFCWQIELNKPETVLAASEIEERYTLSFWDSLMMISDCFPHSDKSKIKKPCNLNALRD